MRKIYTTITFLFLVIILTGCKSIKESRISYYEYFDTIINIQVWDYKDYPTNAKLWKGAEDIIQRLQETFQRTAPKSGEEPSELYQLNKSAGSGNAVKVSDELFYLIKYSIDIAKETNGKFNPAIGALVDLWDISSTDEDEEKTKKRPKDEDILQRLTLLDYNLIELDEENKTVLIPKKGMIIDLGAIVKGYAADKLVEYFKEQGIKHAILDVGGNIYVIGERFEEKDGSTAWKIGIRKPFSSTYVGILSVKDKTIVTSGIYERYFIDPDEEKLYHHILDSSTGFPVENNLLSVTIITESSTLADALSTSVFAMGLEEGMEFINNYENVEAVFVYNDDNGDMQIAKSSGVDKLYNFK